MKYIETTFNLGSFGYAYADDLSDCLTLTQPPTAFQAISAPTSASQFLNKKGPAIDPDDE